MAASSSAGQYHLRVHSQTYPIVLQGNSIHRFNAPIPAFWPTDSCDTLACAGFTICSRRSGAGVMNDCVTARSSGPHRPGRVTPPGGAAVLTRLAHVDVQARGQVTAFD